jgi:hypothetical protein
MARALSSDRSPSSWFTSAQAFFRIPKARIISRGKRSPPMRKCSSERWVCAPQYRSAGTSMLPIVSFSVRVVAMRASPACFPCCLPLRSWRRSLERALAIA